MTVFQYWLGWSLVVIFLALCVWRLDYLQREQIAVLRQIVAAMKAR